MKRSLQKGFTLIELMIVVAIISSIRVKPFCIVRFINHSLES